MRSPRCWPLLVLPALACQADPQTTSITAPPATASPVTSQSVSAASAASIPSVVAPSSSGAPEPSSLDADPAPTGADDGPLMLPSDGGERPAALAERILHVGDSMVPLVGNYLRPLVQRRGGKYYIDSVTSSSTLSWDNERRLQQAMYRYNPEVILISLGSNELFDREPKRRAPAIERLVADTRGRPCLWIGPPAWKQDFGFTEVLKAHLGHCRYLDSTALKLPRMEDGRHPSWAGSHRWATVTWKLLGGVEPVPTGSGPQ